MCLHYTFIHMKYELQLFSVSNTLPTFRYQCILHMINIKTRCQCEGRVKFENYKYYVQAHQWNIPLCSDVPEE